MWCHWCRKANHDDAECFSVRPDGWKPKPDDSEPKPKPRDLAILFRELTCAPHPLLRKP